MMLYFPTGKVYKTSGKEGSVPLSIPTKMEKK
jgi:hypothetical protein